jgi:translation initiation factor 2 beta subunit (eIF-2beta)/eIF-5
MVKFLKKEVAGKKILDSVNGLVLSEKGVLWLKENFTGEKISLIINPVLEQFKKCGEESDEATQLVYLGSVLALLLKYSNIPEKERNGLIDSLENVKY